MPSTIEADPNYYPEFPVINRKPLLHCPAGGSGSFLFQHAYVGNDIEMVNQASTKGIYPTLANWSTWVTVDNIVNICYDLVKRGLL